MSTPSSSQALTTPSALQTEVSTALRNFYTFLSLLPWLDPSDILEPPASGWPNITTENFAPLHKTPAVIELLKHLPYLDMGHSFEKYPFIWSTYPCDYRRSYFQPGELNEGIDCWEIPSTVEREFEFPAWVVPLTFGKVHGVYVMLDTSDGTALLYNVQTLHDPVFEGGDPRAWRNQCYDPGSTARIGDVLGKWKDDYMQLELIGRMSAIGNGPVYDGCGEEYEELKALMLRYGWPDEFDREGCRTAMLQWEQEKLKRA